MVSSYRDPGKRDCIQVVTCCIPSLLGIDHFQASTKTQCLCWYQGTDVVTAGEIWGSLHAMSGFCCWRTIPYSEHLPPIPSFSKAPTAEGHSNCLLGILESHISETDCIIAIGPSDLQST